MKTLAFALALAGFAGLIAPVTSYAKIDQNADYYRAEDRVRNSSGDPKDAARQAGHGQASATSSQ
ncbi:conserved exported hypothetical protein [Paraburkholderia piptadeniae]|uniref:Uncharacterized protein n=1 Tax=Paraburkholderia piptadeniae TaxID=1701573 RepID=A0A1N7RQH5_9BURK|nr:hypothetical protein [Paraburkholderia piptadeniae]SIT37353.1 conserved exported hypothetical protein [Paraburkholderia piptadeniae]